jgi:hypothetical protein
VQGAPLLDRLSAQQIAHLEKRLAEDNRRFARENLRGSERERRKRRTERNVERLEDWVGRLSQAQVRRVREFTDRAPLLDEQRAVDRKRLQAEVMAIIRAKRAQRELAERIADWERGREPTYAAALETWREQAFAMLLDLDRSLTSEQRARFSANLRRYAEEFEALSTR